MELTENKLKQRVQRNILTVSVLILVGKFIAYYLTNSVGVLTDAMESIVNVVAGAISLFSLCLSEKPKDQNHPFGHGKIELISASIEGILISIAGGMIIYEGIKRLLVPTDIQKIDVGIYIIAVSGLLNYLMGWYSIAVGKKYDSIALVAGGKHLQSDTYSTIGLVAGLVLLYFTGIAWIDSAMALIFGSVIIITGISILRKTTDNLLDKADINLLADLTDTLNRNRKPEWIDIHNVKVLKSGNSLYMDCDLTIPWYYNIEQGHKIGARLQEAMKAKYSDHAVLNIHLDPCNIFETPKCNKCMCSDCPYRKEKFVAVEEINVTTFIRNEVEFSE